MRFGWLLTCLLTPKGRVLQILVRYSRSEQRFIALSPGSSNLRVCNLKFLTELTICSTGNFSEEKHSVELLPRRLAIGPSSSYSYSTVLGCKGQSVSVPSAMKGWLNPRIVTPTVLS